MKKCFLIVCHSQSRRSLKLALAAYAGAKRVAAVDVHLKRAQEVCTNALMQADLLLVCSPENFGAASGGIKDLLDRVFYPCERASVSGVPYSLVLSAGNSGDGADKQLTQLFDAMGFRKVQATKRYYGPPTADDQDDVDKLGEALATALEMGVF